MSSPGSGEDTASARRASQQGPEKEPASARHMRPADSGLSTPGERAETAPAARMFVPEHAAPSFMAAPGRARSPASGPEHEPTEAQVHGRTPSKRLAAHAMDPGTNTASEWPVRPSTPAKDIRETQVALRPESGTHTVATQVVGPSEPRTSIVATQVVRPPEPRTHTTQALTVRHPESRTHAVATQVTRPSEPRTHTTPDLVVRSPEPRTPTVATQVMSPPDSGRSSLPARAERPADPVKDASLARGQPAPAARSHASARATPSSATTPGRTQPPVLPPRREPAEPRVHIGEVHVVITESAPASATSSAIPGHGSDLLNRHYLRNA
ncbi:hypothetical protein ACLESO_31725 [Pyxidicoccus sp. 3LG]